MLNDIENLDEHRSIAANKRNSYNYMKQNLPEDTLFIELDWKQKLLMG